MNLKQPRWLTSADGGSRILDLLGIPLAYLLLGAVGLQLAIQPGYASPVFPAAGFALAVVLCRGPAVLPGIWIGSLLLNSGLAVEGFDFNLLRIVTAAAIATGSTMQAALGARLVRRWAGNAWQKLEQEKEIFLLLGLGGALACNVSATVGISTLVGTGIISVDTAPAAWGTWYLGDMLGVILFAPLIIGLIQHQEEAWRSRYKIIVIPILIALIVAGAFFYMTARWEDERQQNDLKKSGEELIRSLDNSLTGHRELMANLVRNFEINPGLTPSQFRHLTTSALADHPELMALSFNAFVKEEERAAFERRMAKSSPSGKFSITERGTDGQLVKARSRPEYVPVTLIEPTRKNLAAIGYDVFSEPVRREAIRRAMESGQSAITTPIRLVQEQKEHVGLLHLAPVYRDLRTPDTTNQGPFQKTENKAR